MHCCLGGWWWRVRGVRSQDWQVTQRSKARCGSRVCLWATVWVEVWHANTRQRFHQSKWSQLLRWVQTFLHLQRSVYAQHKISMTAVDPYATYINLCHPFCVTQWLLLNPEAVLYFWTVWRIWAVTQQMCGQQTQGANADLSLRVFGWISFLVTCQIFIFT